MLNQMPNMVYCAKYNFDTSSTPSPALNCIEAHRRLIKLEEACDTLTQYLSDVICGAHKSLRLMAQKHLADAYAVLVKPKEDKESAVSAHEYIAKAVPSATTIASDFAERRKWLESNRKEALNRMGPVLTELDWGLPMLGLFHSLISSMRCLEDEIEAKTTFISIQTFLDKRAYVYVKDMEPILRYGGLLTQYTRDLQSLCQKFTGLGTMAKIHFPKTGHFHELDSHGRIVGSDGRILPLGIFSISQSLAGREEWLLPFPEECCKIVPDPNLKQITDDHAEEERRLVVQMLMDLQIQVIAPIMEIAAVGRGNVKRLLAEDNYKLNNTSILPPRPPCQRRGMFQRRFF